MIEGIVNNFDEPIIKLDLMLSSDILKKISAVVDTGFNGYISIPANLIGESDWDFIGTEEYELANGEIVEEKVYIGKIIFDGDELQVFSLTNRSTDVLIGTKVLKNKILKVDFKNSRVIIES
ncbi:MAG: hypothetical protein FJW69_03050 [Actinobacteria bacterium]|nr:hypothetical protein [Actinomycetota bacterium]